VAEHIARRLSRHCHERKENQRGTRPPDRHSHATHSCNTVSQYIFREVMVKKQRIELGKVSTAALWPCAGTGACRGPDRSGTPCSEGTKGPPRSAFDSGCAGAAACGGPYFANPVGPLFRDVAC